MASASHGVVIWAWLFWKPYPADNTGLPAAVNPPCLDKNHCFLFDSG